MARRFLSLALLVASAAGCNNLFLDPMKQQPKFKAYSANADGGRSMREPVPGTVPQEIAYDDPALWGGNADAGIFIDHIPLTVDKALLARGQDRFDITCATCHGLLGDGNSVVAKKMLLVPPASLLRDDIRAFPDGRIEEIVRAGWGAMTGYQDQLTARDRWAVVAYVRALQVSQRAPLELAPPAERQKLTAERAQ
jgi:cytochrome c553